jgi:PAS domain S-box-containing protein
VEPSELEARRLAASANALASLGGEVEGTLSEINVPCYVIDRNGVVRWLNAAAQEKFGRKEGHHFLDAVAPADRRRAREAFARNVLGRSRPGDHSADFFDLDGNLMRVDVSSAPLRRGGHVIGMFGVAARIKPTRPAVRHPHVTPRQHEVLHLLADGASTDEIAARLHISRETVRNHVRALLRALGVHSRVQAIVVAQADGLLD